MIAPLGPKEIAAVVIGSRVTAAAEYARRHFSGSAVGVVVHRDDKYDLYGIDPGVPVYLLDGYVVFHYPNVLQHLIERGHTLLSPREAGVMT